MAVYAYHVYQHKNLFFHFSQLLIFNHDRKELLLHPFINRTAIAPYMYPQADDAAALLEEKLFNKNEATFNSDDEARAFAAIGLLLRAFMQPQTNSAEFDNDAFFGN